MTFTLRRSLPLLFALAATAAHGQWTVTRLLTGHYFSVATCGSGNIVGGWVARIGTSENYPVLWNISNAQPSLTYLPGPPSGYSQGILGTTGTRHVGDSGMWSGTPTLFSDFNGRLYAISTNYQAGDRNQNAALWAGDEASYLNLRPSGYASSVNATDNVHQVGWAKGPDSSDKPQACMWSSTPGSFTSLHPAGATSSAAYALSGNEQAGYADFGSGRRPVLWGGSALGFIDLTPVGQTIGGVNGLNADTQVGFVGSEGHYPDLSFDPNTRAYLWRGTPSSAVDLHSFLPPGVFLYSSATAIFSSGGTTFVTGFAYNTTNGSLEPLLWRSPALPSSLTGIIGLNDVVWNPGYPRSITVQVKQGAVTLATRTINVGTTAALSMNVPGAGSAVVTIDGPTQLIRRRNVFLDGNPIDLGSVVLNNGDCDGSGEVDAVDIDFVIAEFGQTFSLGDVDLSGEVDAVDIDIVIACFGNLDE